MTQSTQPSTPFSPSNWAVNATEQYLTIQEGDNILTKGGKCFSRAVADSALTVAALLETVVLAAFTVVTSPLYVFEKTAPVFKSLKGRTSLAASAAAHAAKGIAGYSSLSKEVKEEVKSAPTKFEQVKELTTKIAQKGQIIATRCTSFFSANKANVGKVVCIAAVLTLIYIYHGPILNAINPFGHGTVNPPPLPPPLQPDSVENLFCPADYLSENPLPPTVLEGMCPTGKPFTCDLSLPGQNPLPPTFRFIPPHINNSTTQQSVVLQWLQNPSQTMDERQYRDITHSVKKQFSDSISQQGQNPSPVPFQSNTPYINHSTTRQWLLPEWCQNPSHIFTELKPSDVTDSARKQLGNPSLLPQLELQSSSIIPSRLANFSKSISTWLSSFDPRAALKPSVTAPAWCPIYPNGTQMHDFDGNASNWMGAIPLLGTALLIGIIASLALRCCFRKTASQNLANRAPEAPLANNVQAGLRPGRLSKKDRRAAEKLRKELAGAALQPQAAIHQPT